MYWKLSAAQNSTELSGVWQNFFSHGTLGLLMWGRDIWTGPLLFLVKLTSKLETKIAKIVSL